MWPMLLDYSKEESKRILRRLELGAYASIVSVFRAQGDLSKEKKKILQDLQQTLSISTERHRAEVRRAINDEKLSTIADSVVGNTDANEWMVEGRRLVPLMPRLVPQTAFTATANQTATATVEKNASLPPPSQTCNKNDPAATLAKVPRASSPSSNVVVLPSGTSIHIKGMLNQDDDEELGVVNPQHITSRSLSTESQSASTQTPRVAYTTTSGSVPSSSPVKITISKSPQGRPASVSSGSQPAKVILVTSAGGTQGTPVMQRTTSVPVRNVPTATATNNTGGPMPLRNPVNIPEVVRSASSMAAAAAAAAPNFPGVVTSTTMTSPVSLPVTVPPTLSSSGTNPALFNPSVQIGLGKVRPRVVPRQRYPGVVPGHKSGVVLPMGGPQLISPSSQSHGTSVGTATGHPQVTGPPPPPPASTSMTVAAASSMPIHHQQQQASQPVPLPAQAQVVHHHTTAGGIQVKTLQKPTIQIKQEGGMKIITQSTGNKILPKPSQQVPGPAGGPSTPVVMVNTGQSGSNTTTSAVTMLPRTISTYTAHSGGKVLNITTPGGRVIATTTKASSVVTVNPKTLHLTAVKSGSGSTTVSKPNVIVVQKTQHPRLQSPLVHGSAHIRSVSTSSFPGAIDKDVLGGAGRHVVTAGTPGQPLTTTAATVGRPGERRVIITTSGAGGETTKPVSIIHRSRSDSDGKTSCLLTELIHAARHLPPEAGVAEKTGPSIFEIEGSDNYTSTAVLTSLASLSSSSSAANSSSASSTLPASTVATSSSLFTSNSLQHHTLPLHPLQQLQQPHHRPHPPPQHVQLTTPSSQIKLIDEGRVEIRSSRLKPESESDEQTVSVEQAMSLLNREVVDLTEMDTGHTPTSIAVLPLSSASLEQSRNVQVITSTTTAAAATIVTASHVTTVIPSPVQPKVSILGVSQKASAKVLAPVTGHDKSKDRLLKTASPVEVPREGHLDTQTGIFYPVVSTVTNISTPSSLATTTTLSTLPTSTPSLSLSSTPGSVRVIDEQNNTNNATNFQRLHPLQTKPAADVISVVASSSAIISSSSLPMSAGLPISVSLPLSSSSSSSGQVLQKTMQTMDVNPYSPPLQVVQQLPSRPPESSLSSSSTTALPPSSVSPSPPLLQSSSSSSTQVTATSSSVLISPPVLITSSSKSLSLSLSSSSSSLSSSSSSFLSSSTSTNTKPVVKSLPVNSTPLDIISSSLAHAGLNLDSFVEENNESSEGFDSHVTLTLEDVVKDNSNIEDSDKGEGELSAADQIESALSSSSGSGSINTAAMAEVIREETAKDGTRILTVSNPASSQLDHLHSSSSLAFLNGPPQQQQPQQMVTLPSHPTTSRQAASSPHNRVVLTPTASPSVDTTRSEKLVTLASSSTPLSSTLAARHNLPKNAITLSASNPANSSTALLPSSSDPPSILSLKAPVVDKSPKVITLRLDDLTTTSHQLNQPHALDEEIKLSAANIGLRTSVDISNAVAQRHNQTKDVPNHRVVDGAVSNLPTPTMTSIASIGMTSVTTPLTSGIPLPLSAGGTGDQQTSPVRSSKRKRKNPSDGESASLGAGWVKLASTLLMKVCQFKGSARDKSDIPAAEWFTFPVDPLDAPDYYTVVQNPIDFSTMRKKLKEGQYSSFEDFDADMDLIQSNCFLYNSEGTKVRRDCEEVMAFYHSELRKMMEKQTKDNAMVNPSPLKKTRVGDERGGNSS